MAKKLTYELVKSSFEKRGYTLLSKDYKSAHDKLEYICPKGHSGNIMWYSFKGNRGCSECASNIKLPITFIIKALAEKGYVLLSKEYINNKTKLCYTCPKGHNHSITWSDWKSGYRCPYCNGRPILNINKIREEFNKENYKLLSDNYFNNKKKLDYICDRGHKHSITWNDWSQGYRCPTCANIKMSGPNHPNWQGGKSFEPYCPVWKDIEYKQYIRERDSNKCLNPYCDSKNPNDLTIHHIDYDKKNCGPNNLITICRSCNSKANKDRKWHKAWYQAIMFRRSYILN